MASIQGCECRSRSSLSCKRTGCAPMEMCSVARNMSLWRLLAMNPREFCDLIPRMLPKILAFGFGPSLLKKRQNSQPVELPDLLQDVLMDIFTALEIPDLVCAGSVCSSWHSAYTSLRSFGQYKQHQTPCLFYTSESDGETVACLYSLAEQTVRRLTLPEPPIRSRYLIGSSHGFLVTVDERSEMHLVNPITGEQIALPSVTTIEHVKPVFDDSGTIHQYELSYHVKDKVYREPSIHALDDLRDHLYFKAHVFPDPFTGSYIVVLIHNPYWQLSFARVGDGNWTWLPPNIRYMDCLYMDGLLYALTSVGEIDAFDLTATTVARTRIMRRVRLNTDESMYIIRAPWGDLLQVWRGLEVPKDRAPGSHELRTNKIAVYKVDMAAQDLVEINSLQDHVLFLGHNQTLCLSAKECPQLLANHVYLTEDTRGWIVHNKKYPRDIGVFDLENGSRKEVVSPQIWSNWPGPVWITPSLTKMNKTLSG